MQADQQLTLDIGGNRLRVTTSDHDSADFLRRALADHVIEDDALLGFKLALTDPRGLTAHETPTRRDQSGLCVLMDCTGAILARSSDRNVVLAALTGHLAALNLSAPRWPISRYRLRALITSDHAVLVAAPLLTRPPVIERRLAKLGYRVADVPFVDIDAESLMLQPFDIAWPALAKLESGSGHASSRELAQPVTKLLWPARENASNPSPAQVVHAMAAATLSGNHQQRISGAEQLTEKIEVLPVRVGDDAATYRVLQAGHR